jgi:hypothetical protein
MTKFTTTVGIYFVLALAIFSQLVDAEEDLISTGEFNASSELMRVLPTSDPGEPQSLSSMSSTYDADNSLIVSIYTLHWTGEIYLDDISRSNPIQVSCDEVPYRVMSDLIASAKRAWKTEAPDKIASARKGAITNEYSLVFDKFDNESDRDCPAWSEVQPDDVSGYQISFNSSYDWEYPSRSRGLSGTCCIEKTKFIIYGEDFEDRGSLLEIEVRVGDFKKELSPYADSKNVETGDLLIQNLTASYMIQDRREGKAQDDRGNMYYTYNSCGTLIVPIKNQIALIIDTTGVTPEESLALFNSIRITEIHGLTSKYWLREGNKLFDDGSYEMAVDSYQKAGGNPEATDKIGISLYRLNRYNDTIDWFTSVSPKSSEAWNSYGSALKAMNLEAQAEYAFDRATG